MKKNIIYYLFVMSFMLLHSCTKDNYQNGFDHHAMEESDKKARLKIQRDIDKEQSEQPITKLGEKRKNPFSTKVVDEANRSLYGDRAKPIRTTHQYVKFIPKSEDDVANIQEWTYETNMHVFDFPLDFERIVIGEYYVDPEVENPALTYLYTTVPSGMSMPRVNYEILDELHLDNPDAILMMKAFEIVGNQEEIPAYFFNGRKGLEKDQLVETNYSNLRIPPIINCEPNYIPVLVAPPGTDHSEWYWICEYSPPADPPRNDCGCRLPSNNKRPAGCVQVNYDSPINQVPSLGPTAVQNAMVITMNSWFQWDKTSTDDNGCWEVGRDYNNKMNYWVIFQNRNVTVRDTRNGLWIIFPVHDYNHRSFPFNDINNLYGDNGNAEDRMYWAAGHTLNTVNEYRAWAVNDGIPLPRLRLNWYNHADNGTGNGPGSAPMLKGNLFNSWPALLVAKAFPVIYVSTLPFLPDITNVYGTDMFAATFNSIGFHELAHASHYGIVGESYWFRFRNHIINNNGYGELGNFAANSHPDIVALGEALANYVETLYMPPPLQGVLNPDDNTFIDNFIPSGMMWDLTDNIQDNVNNPLSQNRMDNINGFTAEMIFNSLNNVESIREFRDRLRILHLNDTNNTQNNFNTFLDFHDVL